jgi:RimJ/RimL family protein N-acetyltransferase
MRAWIYLKEEWDPALLRTPIPESIAVLMADAEGKEEEKEREAVIRQTLSTENIHVEDALLIASTDASIRAAQHMQLAVAAYANPLFPGQTYAGAKMVIEGFDEVDADFLERVYERERGIPWVIARTKRCIIREFAMSDLRAMVELYGQPGITSQNRGFLEPLLAPEEERAYQEAYIANMYGYYGYGMWLVTDRDSGSVIGRAGLGHREFHGITELELGYLIDPRWQGQGIATEVCRAILAFARENLDFPRINALTDAANTPSIALLHRLGFSCMEDVQMAGRRMKRYTYSFSCEKSRKIP